MARQLGVIGGVLHGTCDICGKSYPLTFRKFSKYFSDIPMTDSIRIEMVEGGTVAISTCKVCRECAGKVMAHMVLMKKEAGNTEVL